MENIIEIKDLAFRYQMNQEHYDVNHVSFHVKRGEWLSIVGHNGSGKSTTVRLIDGLLEAESGEIWIDGDLLTPENVWEKRRKIGMVFQNPDNQFVGLSGGQKQRVAIAGVVALRPDILILDESTSMLDPEGRLELIKIVQEIRKDHQMTVISITHDLEEVSMSDRVLVMKKGQVESTSSPRELFSRSDIDKIGLDQPFVNQLRQSLRKSGLNLPDLYMTEDELEEALWELL